MESGITDSEIKFFEEKLGTHTGYSNTFLLIQNLKDVIRSNDSVASDSIVEKLLTLLESAKFDNKKTACFYYRTITEVLVTGLSIQNHTKNLANPFSELTGILLTSKGNRHRGIAEGLGSLPVKMKSSGFFEEEKTDITQIDFDRFHRLSGIGSVRETKWMGRSLILYADEGVTVIKMFRREDMPEEVIQESYWQNYFCSQKVSFKKGFRSPLPIKVEHSYVFRLNGFENIKPPSELLHENAYAIAYKAPEGYFNYPNQMEKDVDNSFVLEVLSRNAWLLGRFLSKGIVHTAPIPLFHNRVQRSKRSDGGFYDWTKGGRLDQWLASCNYPNIGASGLRDFEHLAPFVKKGRYLYECIGMHLLSLLLIAGSCFRNADPFENSSGDYRHLFDKGLFKELIETILAEYYSGFVGESFPKWFNIDYDHLTSRMIEEMGMDTHMEEMLRVVDQRSMTEEAFREFLKKRGYEGDIEKTVKGKEDIVTRTGPHLGGFNQKISLPELIEFLETAAGLCIIGKYCHQSGIRM